MHAQSMMSDDGVLVTLTQMQRKSNLGVSTIRRLARESGSEVKIGKCYRINQKIFFDHISRKYSK